MVENPFGGVLVQTAVRMDVDGLIGFDRFVFSSSAALLVRTPTN